MVQVDCRRPSVTTEDFPSAEDVLRSPCTDNRPTTTSAGPCVTAVFRYWIKVKVKETDLYGAFIEVPYTQGAQVLITQVLPANYTVPASTS